MVRSSQSKARVDHRDKSQFEHDVSLSPMNTLTLIDKLNFFRVLKLPLRLTRLIFTR